MAARSEWEYWAEGGGLFAIGKLRKTDRHYGVHTVTRYLCAVGNAGIAQSVVDGLNRLEEEHAAEIAKLKALSLTCCSCKQAMGCLDELKAHIVTCPEHPIAQYVAVEREACAKIADDRAKQLDAAKADGGSKWADDLDVRIGDCWQIAGEIRDRGKE